MEILITISHKWNRFLSIFDNRVMPQNIKKNVGFSESPELKHLSEIINDTKPIYT